jgi:hypothetical protein
MRIIFTIIFSLTIFGSYGQVPSYFPNLNKVFFYSHKKFIFGYDSKTIKFLNTKCSDLPQSDYWYCPSDDYQGTIKLARIYNDKIKDTLDVLFDAGPSDDPEFYISKKDGKIIGRISALEFYIAENNIIYSAGHTNNMFNKRQKFQLLQDTLLEIKQPYYYVGLKSKTVSTLTLYKSKTGNEVLATLPKDYQVEILVCEQNTDNSETLFLVKTEFGLVGWLRLKDKYTYDTPIEGLLFMGD